VILMALELVTGYKGFDHVTAEQDADLYRGIFGDACIIDVGSKMVPVIQTANQITIPDGVAIYDGRMISIGYGETDQVAIASGTSGYSRYDIIVVKYTRVEDTGVESVEFQVVEGTPTTSTPSDPSYSNLDIRTGVLVSQKPFARVRLSGTSIAGIDMLVDTLPPLAKILSGATKVLVAV
jgi:hypothetical protein